MLGNSTPPPGNTTPPVAGFCETAVSIPFPGMGASVFGLGNSALLVLSVLWVVVQLHKEYRRSWHDQNLPLMRLLPSEDRQQVNGGRGGAPSAPLVRPEYYFLLIVSCFVFVVQTFGWVLPKPSLSFSAATFVVFSCCVFTDTFFVFHLLRPPTSGVRLTIALSAATALACLGSLYALPGPMPDTDCAYCCIHYPKPGIEIIWGIVGAANMWLAVCAEMRWAVVPCLPKTWTPVPRRALSAWCALMSVPYVASSVALSLLHYVDAHMDSGWCLLFVANVTYTLGYAPVLYRCATWDSKECKAFEVARALDHTIGFVPAIAEDGGRDDESLEFGEGRGGGGRGGGGGGGRKDRGGRGGRRGGGGGGGGGSITSGRGPGWEILPLLLDPHVRMIDPRDVHIVRRLGGGTFGSVALATWRHVPVAVKRLRTVNVRCEDSLRALAHEAGLLSRLHHPNIVLFLGILVARDSCAIVTEHMSGGSVDDLIRLASLPTNRGLLGGTFRWAPRAATSLKILSDCAVGMAYLHTLDPPLLHRDLKSGNLLIEETGGGGGGGGGASSFSLSSSSSYSSSSPGVTSSSTDRNGGGAGRGSGGGGSNSSSSSSSSRSSGGGCGGFHGGIRCKVADFGLSTQKDASATLGRIGTPAWCAPEVLRLDTYGAKADVFSFAVVMWEVLSRQTPPFKGMNGIRMAHEVAYNGLRPPVQELLDIEEEEARGEEAERATRGAMRGPRQDAKEAGAGVVGVAGDAKGAGARAGYFPPRMLVDLMQACWADDPRSRPTFAEICQRLREVGTTAVRTTPKPAGKTTTGVARNV